MVGKNNAAEQTCTSKLQTIESPMSSQEVVGRLLLGAWHGDANSNSSQQRVSKRDRLPTPLRTARNVPLRFTRALQYAPVWEPKGN